MSTEVTATTKQVEEKRPWRWWKREPEKLAKLEFAFMNGMTDEQAIFYAGITAAQLYYFQRLTPDFRSRKELLKNQIRYQARKNIADAINEGDLQQSAWYLDRTDPDFTPKTKGLNLNVTVDGDALEDAKKEELSRILGNNV